MKLTLNIQLIGKGYLCKDVSEWSWFQITDALKFLFDLGFKKVIIKSEEE